MSILIECACHKKQAVKNKICSTCGADLDKLKKTQSRYWISYRINGKQKTEFVGTSKKEAEDALGKRRVQRREHKFFEMLPESRMTFRQLAEWYFKLESVKGLRSYEKLKDVLENVVDYLGDRMLESIKSVDLENYIAKRKAERKAPATIQMELAIAKMAINKALNNDMISARTLKAFKTVKSPLRAGSNARTRIVSLDEYKRVYSAAPHYLRVALTLSLYCGMRRGEICTLRWSDINLKTGFIRLPAERTKEQKAKTIPIPETVKNILNGTPRSLKSDYVILNGDKPVFIGTFTNAVYFACRDMGVTYGTKTDGGMRFHDLRATCKTFMAKAGIDSALRSKLLGHALQGMDKYYLRFEDADLKAASDKYAAWLDAQMGDDAWLTLGKQMSKNTP